MNNVCKEHEWMIEIPSGIVYCKNCTLRRVKPIDFKIPENLEQINKQQWEDIFNEFALSDEYRQSLAINLSWAFSKWLKENYTPPEKKKPLI